MSDPSPAIEGKLRGQGVGLPDFCSLPVLFALLLVGAMTVTLMWLTPGEAARIEDYTVAMLFVAWIAALATLALCKLRNQLERLPGLFPYAGVWVLLVVLVAAAAMIVAALDHSLGMGLTPVSTAPFVRRCTAVTALLGAGLLRYFYVVAQWQARMAAVAQAQVDALQARIRPHFLFNSMNTVAALVRVDPNAAERTVENLAELFRAALGADRAAVGTLYEELQLVDRYLAIEQLRLGSRLAIRRDIGDLPVAFPMPRLLLQPLVENAVRYGVQPSVEGGTVNISGHAHHGGVELRIDNPLHDAPVSGGHGHGLDNVRQRIAHHFGTAARVDAGPIDGRFVVSIYLPGAPRHARPGR
jgi:two-component system sensor histidine kinase AlgZ